MCLPLLEHFNFLLTALIWRNLDTNYDTQFVDQPTPESLGWEVTSNRGKPLGVDVGSFLRIWKTEEFLYPL